MTETKIIPRYYMETIVGRLLRESSAMEHVHLGFIESPSLAMLSPHLNLRELLETSAALAYLRRAPTQEEVPEDLCGFLKLANKKKIRVRKKSGTEEYANTHLWLRNAEPRLSRGEMDKDIEDAIERHTPFSESTWEQRIQAIDPITAKTLRLQFVGEPTYHLDFVYGTNEREGVVIDPRNNRVILYVDAEGTLYKKAVHAKGIGNLLTKMPPFYIVHEKITPESKPAIVKPTIREVIGVTTEEPAQRNLF